MRHNPGEKKKKKRSYIREASSVDDLLEITQGILARQESAYCHCKISATDK